MDERVLRAMAKWPNVPVVYGWVALDCRGRWRLDGGLVRNRNTAQAINRNYACDEAGRSYYQNGPQRAYVNLDYTPWVYVLDGERRLQTHTGLELEMLHSAWLDDESNLLLVSEHGVGVVSDVDLDLITEQFCDVEGQRLEDEMIEQHLQTPSKQSSCGIYLKWEDKLLAIARIKREEVATRFGYIAKPVADDHSVKSEHKEET